MQVFVLTVDEQGGTEVIGVYPTAGKAMMAGMAHAEVELEWESDWEAGLHEAQVETDDVSMHLNVEGFECDGVVEA